jgi:DNA mismatch endonuclease (patch repair protein)
MSAIRGKDTKPEMIVRRLVHRLGYRFRLHRRDLPGAPDIVLPRHRKIILVHGCYWHMHSCRWGSVTPKTNEAFWQAKRTGNVERDKRNVAELKRLGWKILTVWECEKRDLPRLTARIRAFLAR